MKKIPIIFTLVAVGLAMGFSDACAQNTQNTDLHPPYLAEEELAVSNGKEVPVLEEGEEGAVLERGLRRFQLKKKPRKRIILPKKPGTKKKRFRLKRRPIAPPSGSSNTPQGGGTAPPVEPLDSREPPEPIEPPDQVDLPPQCVWHTSDIIDPRIDVSAQERLMAMMSRGGKERLDASAMIGAVKQGDLAGILLAPRKVVVDRGQRLTPPKGWWELIPPGQLGTCWQEPIGEPPMILYRDKNGESTWEPSIIEHSLRTTWAQCGLPTPVPACSYLVDLHKPPPEPDSPDHTPEGDGYGNLQVLVKSEGKAIAGATVLVRGTRRLLTGATNGEGVASFSLFPMQKRIKVVVIGVSGFYPHTSEFGFLPNETKGISVELEPIPLSDPG